MQVGLRYFRVTKLKSGSYFCVLWEGEWKCWIRSKAHLGHRVIRTQVTALSKNLKMKWGRAFSFLLQVRYLGAPFTLSKLIL